MLQVIDAGGQAALLAPTEVLAQQHYRSITDLLGPFGQAGRLDGADQATRVALLTGSQGRRPAARRCSTPRPAPPGIVIGTHALLTEHVQFADLGMVVIDEQHRFGVEQRDALREKARGSAPARAGDDRDPDPAHGRHDRLRRPGHLHPHRAAGRPLADRHPRCPGGGKTPLPGAGVGAHPGGGDGRPPGLRRLPPDRRG
jgi:RecG-like helicase